MSWILEKIINKVTNYEYQIVKRTTYGYMENLIELILCDVFAKVLLAYTAKSGIHTAVVGCDPHLFNNIETLQGFGFIIGGYYGTKENDIFHPIRPIQELKNSDYDLLILSAPSLKEEDSLIKELDEIVGPENELECPLLRIGKLRTTFYSAFSKLKIHHFSNSALNPRKIALLALGLSVTRQKGCVVECGTYMGGTSILMGMLLREWKDSRRIYAFDTFEGIPKPTDKDGDTVYQENVFIDTSYELVRKHVKAHNLDRTVIIHKGLVQDMLPLIWQDEQYVSLALVDTDQYLGTVESLKQILPRLQKNGIILIDDYSLSGIQKAINEVKKEYPKLKGALITYNLYMLWNETDYKFLSHW